MKLNILLTAASMLATVSHGAIINLSDFDNETTAGLGITPGTQEFADGGGDHAGQSALGIADANPRSGAYSYVASNTTVANGNGWGGTWTGVSSLGGNDGSNVTTREDALANATPSNPLSYVEISEGTTFSISAWVATDSSNPITGSVVTNVRLELKNASNTEISRNDNGAALGAGDISSTYQQISHSYTITAQDVAAGVDSVTAVFATDGHGHENGSGVVYADDILFSVDDGSFVTVIPEPSSILLGLLGIIGFAARRRR